MKKHLSLLLALLLILTALLGAVACTETPPDTGNDGSTDTGEDPGNSGTTDKTEEKIPLDYLPTDRYGTADAPASYHILEWSANGSTEVGVSWIPWEEGDVQEMDGDKLGEAVYARNRAVEERYAVAITSEYAQIEVAPTISSLMSTNHTSGDDKYQLMTIRAVGLSEMVLNGYLLDMNTLSDYLHTDQPWWVADSVVSYTLGEHLYAACTELLLRDKGATAALFFNTQLADDHEVGDLFQMVRDHEWTVEEMILICDAVAHDEDGSTMLDSAKDIWGMIGSDDPPYYFYNGFGYKFARVNDDGLLEAEFGVNGDTITVLQDIFTDICFQDWYFNNENKNANQNPDGVKMFESGQVLFKPGLIKHTTTELKEMEQQYGILPMPLYDEDQEQYSSLVWYHHDSVLGIPAAVKDAEMCAVILEALSWESYYTVSTVFYEGILLDRAAKDANSKEMLQLILDTRSYDPGLYWDGDSGLQGGEGILRKPNKTQSADIASIWTSYGGVFQDNLQEVNDIIQNKD